MLYVNGNAYGLFQVIDGDIRILNAVDAEPRFLLGENDLTGNYGICGWNTANKYLTFGTDFNGLKIQGSFFHLGNTFPLYCTSLSYGSTEMFRCDQTDNTIKVFYDLVCSGHVKPGSDPDAASSSNVGAYRTESGVAEVCREISTGVYAWVPVIYPNISPTITVTAEQPLALTLADIDFSDITVTPPTTTCTVFYEFIFACSGIITTDAAIFSGQVLLDGSVVSQTPVTLFPTNAASGQGATAQIIMYCQVDSWGLTGKTFKCQGAEYGAASECVLHASNYWLGSEQALLVKPRLRVWFEELG